VKFVLPTTLDDSTKAYREGYNQGRFDAIADIPHAVQTGYSVVAVVKCEDCKRFIEYCDTFKPPVEGTHGDCGMRLMQVCDNRDAAVKRDDYCSHGERREAKENSYER
jgi:hypothetical protein